MNERDTFTRIVLNSLLKKCCNKCVYRFVFHYLFYCTFDGLWNKKYFHCYVAVCSLRGMVAYSLYNFKLWKIGYGYIVICQQIYYNTFRIKLLPEASNFLKIKSKMRYLLNNTKIRSHFFYENTKDYLSLDFIFYMQ